MSNPILDRMLNRWHIKVMSLLLAAVLFWLHRTNSMEERFFSIPLEVRVDSDYIIAQEHSRSVRISLRGNADIDAILEEDISALIDFSSHTEEGSFREAVQIFKRGTALAVEDLEIRVEPGEMLLYQERKTERSLPVEPSLLGFPSMGYELTQFFVSPSSVTVVGPRSIMEGLDRIATETIDVSERYEDFNVSSRLVRPHPLVQIPGGEVVEFRGVISETIMVHTLANIGLGLVDLPVNLQVQGDLPQGSLTLQGSQLELQSLDEDQVLFTLDCRDIRRPGVYILPVQVDLSGPFAVLNYQPREVTLELIEVP